MKKLFTLLTLLLTVVGVVKADETIFTYTVTGTDVSNQPSSELPQVFGRTASGTIGGTCYFNITGTSGNHGYFKTDGSIHNYNFGTGSAYVQVTLADSKTFKTGDKVNIYGFCANDNYGSRGFFVSTNNGTENQLTSPFFPNRTVQSNELTVTLDNHYDGVSTLYIKRNSGCNFIGVSILREDASAPKTITFTPGSGEIGAGSKITISSVGATTIKYQWATSVIDGEGDWSSATTYDEDHKPEVPAVGASNTVLSVCATNAIGSTYGFATYTPLNVIQKIIYSLEGGIGTAEVTADNATVTDKTSLVLSNTAGRIKLTAPSGEQFKNGDAITFTGSIGNTAKAYGIKYGATTSLGTNLFVAAGEPCSVEGTLTLSSSTSELFIGRYDGSTTTMTSFIVSRPTIVYPVSTISGRNYATYVTTKKLDFGSAEGITAYIATGLNGSKTAVVLEEVNVVPAGTPIIVKTDSKGATVNVPVTTADADDVTGNKLVAGDGTAATTEHYFLKEDMFHQANAGTLKSGKAYLHITTLAPVLNIEFTGNTTGINVINQKEEVRGQFYDLQGRKVAQPTKGLYIVNGKKVIIK